MTSNGPTGIKKQLNQSYKCFLTLLRFYYINNVCHFFKVMITHITTQTADFLTASQTLLLCM